MGLEETSGFHRSNDLIENQKVKEEKRMKWQKCVYAVSVLGMFVSGALMKSAAREESKPAAKAEVSIDNFAFTPTELTVAAGTTVEWVNRDDIPHVVVSDDKKTFKSKALDTDDKFSYTFTKPGTYSYFCSVHPKMTGKVIVQ
jgi:plastocyanin